MSEISSNRFTEAQDAEVSRWRDCASNRDVVRHEIAEHADIGNHLRRAVGDRTFERGLEVGIGPYSMGFLAPHFHDRLKAIDGIDPLPRLDVRVDDAELQAQVEAIRGRVHYTRGPAEALPYESSTYDIVSCINVVDHAQSPDAILREINRVLKPGGILAFAVSTLSRLGEAAWKIRRRMNPNTFLFLAHPHTFQWPRADRLVQTVPGETLWCDRPGWLTREAGHGRMSYWIRRKET